jgi:predicted RNase H-like HicB family nuclease
MAARRDPSARRRIITLTAGSIRNAYLPLVGLIEGFFPPDAVGGRSKQHAARRVVRLSVGLDRVVETDIDGGKQVFRRRDWVKPFIKAHGLRSGDRVVIEELAAYRYHVYPQPAAGAHDVANGDSDTRLEIEVELDRDGRWIGEVRELPGVLAYGTTRHEAETRVKALSLRVIADRLEHGEAAPAGSRISFAVA